MVRTFDPPETAPNGPAAPDISPKQEAAAFALAAGLTVGEAARRSGAGERTIKTWTAACPAFNRRVTQLRSEMTGRTLGRLVDGMAFAADALRKLLTAKSESVRLSAARAVIELGTKLRETVDLEERIAALESGPQQRRRAG